MNRFNQGSWSKVQCEMILASLSFADYFRPRFFLLENVRNFTSFNKGNISLNSGFSPPNGLSGRYNFLFTHS